MKALKLIALVTVVWTLLPFQTEAQEVPAKEGVRVVVLGTIQDAGSPHIACDKDCCRNLFLRPATNRKVVSLGLIDGRTGKTFMFEATPDMPEQMKLLKAESGSETETPDGIFLTHAHIGHYSGLMYLGKEAMNAQEVPVFAMPRMKSFLEDNGPWSLLADNDNIALSKLKAEKAIEPAPGIKVTPILVPHRDEFSETVGYRIEGLEKSLLFIPDIDKWEKWNRSIVEEIAKVDYALLDGTFYDAEEINHRDISEIPHPFIIESMELFKDLSKEEKAKIHFIHFNHTNPVIKTASPQFEEVVKAGFNFASHGQIIDL
jgi:pyrroloquinoline quinone biosynthesis protein B